MAVTLDKEICYVNVYETWQEFGGREEGEWYYGCGEWVVSYYTSYQSALKFLEQAKKEFPTTKEPYRVNHRKGDSYDIRIEGEEPQDWPVNRPTYS